MGIRVWIKGKYVDGYHPSAKDKLPYIRLPRTSTDGIRRFTDSSIVIQIKKVFLLS